MREITLKGWKKSGAGATAVGYNNETDPHLMLKVFSSSIVGAQYALAEYELSQKMTGLGLRTPKALELVKCEGYPAIIYERIVNKKSMSRLCASDPGHIEHWAAVFAHECCTLHSTICTESCFVSRKAQMLAEVQTHKGYNARARKMISELSGELSDDPYCLHGDLQTGNLIVDTDTDTPYWIDLGSFACGDRMFDLSCLYFFCKHPIGRLLGWKLCHMNFASLRRFWGAFEEAYSKESGCTGIGEKAARYVPLYLVYTIGIQNYRGLTARVFDAYINHIRY